MAKLEFQDLRFEVEKERIKVSFLKIFYFYIKKADLDKIAAFNIQNNSIIFDKISEEKAEKQFSRLLSKGFQQLRSKITDNPTLYIHKNSGIPLIGSLSFGIIDKGTDMLELKPITGCNIDCIFCSVDEGLSTKKTTDIVVEKDYLIQETKKLLEFKKQPVHIYINPHGEPLLYADIVPLVKELSNVDYVKAISIITNATLLTESLAEQLIEAGLTEFNVSLNALDPEKANKIAGTASYNIKKITTVLKKIKDMVKVIITPVLIKNINDKEIEKLVEYAKNNDFEIMIQNFLLNKRGRKPAKELKFNEFYSYLRELEAKYDMKLIRQAKIIKTKELPKPFKKGQVIEAEAISEGRYNNEFLAVSKARIITVKSNYTKTKKIKIKLTKDRYNIFYAIKN
jgi:hypothetical protein